MIDYIDYDTLVKIGWTALLGWNLKETVANGKKVAVLEAKIENGLTRGMATLQEKISDHIDGEEHRIIQALAGRGRKKRK